MTETAREVNVYQHFGLALLAKKELSDHQVESWLEYRDGRKVDESLPEAEEGEIVLLVNENDYDSARLMLGDDFETVMKCPHCSSTRVGEHENLKGWQLALMFFTVIPLILYLIHASDKGKEFICRDCQWRWRPAPVNHAAIDI